jgi:hypothetical protein
MGIGPGRLPTASASPAAQRVSCVMENRHINIDQLHLATSLCHATVHAIILEDVKSKKVRADWVTMDLVPNKGREGYIIARSCLLVTTRTRGLTLDSNLCTIILFLSLYSSTCFGHPCAHLQEDQLYIHNWFNVISFVGRTVGRLVKDFTNIPTVRPTNEMTLNQLL